MNAQSIIFTNNTRYAIDEQYSGGGAVRPYWGGQVTLLGPPYPLVGRTNSIISKVLQERLLNRCNN